MVLNKFTRGKQIETAINIYFTRKFAGAPGWRRPAARNDFESAFVLSTLLVRLDATGLLCDVYLHLLAFERFK